MKKLTLLIAPLFILSFGLLAQQPLTVSPGLVVTSPTAGTSGLQFGALNSTKVLTLDNMGNVILGNASSGGGGSSSSAAINLPVYANDLARNTAIPTPTTGMLVYNTIAGGPEYYAGTGWGSLALWRLISGRIVATGGGAVGIEAANFTSQWTSSLANPLFNSTGATNVFFRYGHPTSTAAIYQESTTGHNVSSSNINWRHINSATPQVTTNLFGYEAGTFTINGFTKLGDEATTTTSGVTTSVPAIKTLLLTGGMGAATTTVPHGLNYNKIVDIKVLVLSTSINGGRLVAEGVTDPAGYQFVTYTDGNNVYIVRNATNSANIAPLAGLVTAAYKIFITYIP
jgi:hypothetical protein